MLCQFTFENFKSYRDQTVFDMQAAGIKEFSSSLLPSQNPEKFPSLLPVAAIYGPNGGGKSILLEAFVYLISAVISPIKEVRPKEFHKFLALMHSYEPFLLDDASQEKPTCFQLYFRTAEAEFRYELSLLSDQIVYESLYRTRLDCARISPVLVFERDGDDISLGTALTEGKVQLPSDFNDTLPLLSFLYYSFHIPYISDAVSWFKNCYTVNYSMGKRESIVAPFHEDEPALKAAFLSLLNKIGVPVSDYTIERIEDGEGKVHSKIRTIHTVGEHIYSLPLSAESQGTIKLFSFLPVAIRSLQTGGVVLVDELDAKLHPQLLRSVIRLYTNPATNPNHAQLVFVSQDVSTMRSEFLRRDEIWFAARDDESVSHLWSLYDLKDARGEHVKPVVAYDKQYLEGRYGADPYLKQMLDWRVPDASVSTQTKEE